MSKVEIKVTLESEEDRVMGLSEAYELYTALRDVFTRDDGMRGIAAQMSIADSLERDRQVRQKSLG